MSVERLENPGSTSCEIAVGGIAISGRSREEFLSDVAEWARNGRSAYVCFVTAHMIALAQEDREVRLALSEADIRNADGTPVAWCARFLCGRSVAVLDGPSVMPLLFAVAEHQGLTVGFVGGRPATLNLLTKKAKETHPDLRVGCAISPPFGDVCSEENDRILNVVERSGVQMLFVGLGSPKQEKWMAAHQNRVRAVMFGVGAAFDFYVGDKHMPPKWFQSMGLTWLYRLAQEPRRLWRRNSHYGLRFLLMATRQIVLRSRFETH